MSALSAVTIDETALKNYTEVVRTDCQTILCEIQRDAAVFLLDGTPPPYALHITATEHALMLSLNGTDIPLHFSPLRRILVDYEMMIGAHGSALRHGAPHSRAEAIDMGRRAMHNEGAGLVLAELSPHLSADLGTARLLFTLVFLLTQRR